VTSSWRGAGGLTVQRRGLVGHQHVSISGCSAAKECQRGRWDLSELGRHVLGFRFPNLSAKRRPASDGPHERGRAKSNEILCSPCSAGARRRGPATRERGPLVRFESKCHLPCKTVHFGTPPRRHEPVEWDAMPVSQLRRVIYVCRVPGVPLDQGLSHLREPTETVFLVSAVSARVGHESNPAGGTHPPN